MERLKQRTALALAGAAMTLAVCAGRATAQESELYGVLKDAPPVQISITKYKTAHFCLHTDLPEDKANQALKEMEAALNFAVHYWREKSRGQIECYLASDVASWPEATLPHPLARVWIGEIGGATVSDAPDSHQPSRLKAVIYSSTLPGVLPHEVIHAYCLQTFGATGPDWYKEGMAELASHCVADPTCTWFPDHLLENLSKSQLKSVRSIVGGGNFTDSTARSLGVMLANRTDSARPVLLSHWNADATKEVEQMHPPYASSWALCHLLAKNPNYSAHFRRLGTRYLVRKHGNFEKMFDPVIKELDFEFQHFVQNIASGYRVDLCAWDWKKKFKAIEGMQSISRRVSADHGYQPTGLWVEGGESYTFSSTGNWSTGTGPTDANGKQNGRGKLTAVVFHDYELAPQVELGTGGSFTATHSGKLYVRCNDAWNELADNSGSVVVTFHASAN